MILTQIIALQTSGYLTLQVLLVRRFVLGKLMVPPPHLVACGLSIVLSSDIQWDEENFLDKALPRYPVTVSVEC